MFDLPVATLHLGTKIHSKPQISKLVMRRLQISSGKVLQYSKKHSFPQSSRPVLEARVRYSVKEEVEERRGGRVL